MITFESFLYSIGKVDPFKFHLLENARGLIDRDDYFHAAWAMAWVPKNDNSGESLVYAITALRVAHKHVMCVLNQTESEVKDRMWHNGEARYLPWVASWLTNVPRPVVMNGGIIAAK